MSRLLGSVPVAGFFAAGELGPVGSKNFLQCQPATEPDEKSDRTAATTRLVIMPNRPTRQLRQLLEASRHERGEGGRRARALLR